MVGIIEKDIYLEEIIDRYQDLIFSICCKMTGNYFTAEDLTQETFLSAYRKMDSFDGNYEKAWLCRIAINKCLDYSKKAQRREQPKEAETLLQLEAAGETVEGKVLAKEVRQELREACTGLPPPYDIIALAYFYEEKSPQQIAEETGRNLKTVQTQIYRAKARLRKTFEAKGGRQNETKSKF